MPQLYQWREKQLRMKEGSIYQDLLGADFDRLGPVLQRVHGPQTHVHAAGLVEVTHGKGWIVRWVNRMMDVPPAKGAVGLSLEIRRSRLRETWIRSFEGKPLVTEQWAEDGLFVEAIGNIRMGMRLRLVQGGLLFEPVYTKLFGIRLPRLLGVSVFAEVREQHEGWTVLVETKSGFLGILFRYKGHIRITT